MILGGLNDTKANRTAVQMETDYGSILDALAAAKVFPTAIGILPFSGSAWSAPRETVRVTFNAWSHDEPRLRAGRGRFVSLETRLGDGASPPALQEAYDISDGEHPSAEGARVIGRCIGSRF